jgi:hypothetical protein
MTALDWEGCANVRDVGGIVRADNIRRLTTPAGSHSSTTA